jgi:glycosyltransferase involved in cell wall biosynthesis
VSALARHTRPAWELVAIDDGGTDGMADYLAGVRDVAPFPVTIITNTRRRGFTAACNQGLAAARGELVALLRDDVVITDGWLDQLTALMASDAALGMTGPMSHGAQPPQSVPEVPYASVEQMHRFAAQWRCAQRGKWLKTDRLAGFCMLIKRRVIDAAGPLDEGTDADAWAHDQSRRARRAGFELAVARDLFVHRGPFGQAGVRDEPASGGRRCPVSLTMIVRDEEKNLPACLASAAGLFDEVVVVDTGSADRTVEVARSFGARVFSFDWVDDFSAARNAALAHATGAYAFWLDADDRLEAPQRERLRTLFDGLQAPDMAYVVRCGCDPAPGEGGGGPTVVDHVRLFPLRPDVRWTYRVHEQILPALRRAGVPVRWSDAVIRHVGYSDRAVRRKKLERDWKILESERAERPDDPFVLFNLGQVALELGETGPALAYLRRSLAGSAPQDSITSKLHALIARAHQRAGELDAALAACAAGLADDPDDAELLFRQGVLHRLRGDAAEAGACWRRLLTLRRPERFASIDTGIYGHVTRRNLARLAEEQDNRAEAAGHWGEVLAECPGDAEAKRALERLGARLGAPNDRAS